MGPTPFEEGRVEFKKKMKRNVVKKGSYLFTVCINSVGGL